MQKNPAVAGEIHRQICRWRRYQSKLAAIEHDSSPPEFSVFVGIKSDKLLIFDNFTAAESQGCWRNLGCPFAMRPTRTIR